MIPVGFAGASSSYSITNSVRLNGTSDYLSKTLTTSTTTSGSVWVKRAKLGAVSPIFDNKVYFTSGDALYAFGLTSTALYRDPSAWYHIFWNGTGVYVNGSLVTGSGTYTAAFVTNPRLGFDGTNYFSGYLSDFAFWNGTSASLQGGATDSNGVWAARKPSAGYSFLAFGSSGALGTDTSGNSNTWSVTGSPVQTTDTPTSNSCTWNPLDRSTGATAMTISNGNLTAISTSATRIDGVYSTVAMSSGKWYYETYLNTRSSAYPTCGVCSTDFDSTGSGWAYQGGNPSNTKGAAVQPSGTMWLNGSSSPSGLTWAAGDYCRVAVDFDAKKIWFGKGASWHSGDPATGTGGSSFATAGGTAFKFQMTLGDSITGTVNFGATAFAYTPPTGFKALCTANLPSVAVTTSGTFTGNANADGPFVWTNGNPATLTINGNAVTFGTHADKTAGGFKLRSSSASYNTSGSNTWTATTGKRFVYSATSINTAQGNP